MRFSWVLAGRILTRGLVWFARGALVLSGSFAAYLLWLLGDTGSFDPLPAASVRACAPLTGLRAMIAARADPESGTVYLLGIAPGEKDPRLFAYFPNAAQNRLRPLELRGPKRFDPQGLGLWTGTTGSQGMPGPHSLFVINRISEEDRVEIFDLKGDRVVHRETVSDPAFVALTDLVPVGPRQFYAAIGYSRHSILDHLGENLLGLPRSKLLYFDGTLADPVARGLTTLRSLTLSLDRHHLYVTELLRHRIRRFARDPKTGALREDGRTTLSAMPFMISRDPQGGLWVAVQHRLGLLALQALDRRVAVPSSVLHLAAGGSEPAVMLADEGQRFPGVQLALWSRNQLFLGAGRNGPPQFCDFPLGRGFIEQQ